MVTTSSLCVYPLSPTYMILHRYLYYLSLILSVLYPTPPPLIKGAFAFSLTYSSTAALYAVLILAIPLPTSTTIMDPPLLNLDILGLWAVLSPASILLLPLLTWSRSLQGAQSQSARPIIRIWGILIPIGAACTFALLQTSNRGSDASALPDCPALALAADAQKLRLRDPNHVLAVPAARIFSPLYTTLATRLAPLTFIPLACGALSSLVDIAAPSPSLRRAVEVSSTDSASTSPWAAARKLFLLLRRVVLWLTPGWLGPVMVVNELYLLRGWPAGVPEAESMYEVGQWGLVAGLGFVSAAAVVSWVAGGGSREERYGGADDDGCVA